MKSTARLFLISLITTLTIILCSCGNDQDHRALNREIFELTGPVKKATITVTDMNCSSCTNKIRAALLNCKGVKSADVIFQSQDNVVVSFYTDHLTILKIRQIIENLGHKIGLIKDE